LNDGVFSNFKQKSREQEIDIKINSLWRPFRWRE
jgi:hypothetical protein